MGLGWRSAQTVSDELVEKLKEYRGKIRVGFYLENSLNVVRMLCTILEAAVLPEHSTNACYNKKCAIHVTAPAWPKYCNLLQSVTR